MSDAGAKNMINQIAPLYKVWFLAASFVAEKRLFVVLNVALFYQINLFKVSLKNYKTRVLNAIFLFEEPQNPYFMQFSRAFLQRLQFLLARPIKALNFSELSNKKLLSLQSLLVRRNIVQFFLETQRKIWVENCYYWSLGSRLRLWFEHRR